MGYTKPNDPAAPANAAAFADQAEPDKVDFDILAAAFGGVSSAQVYGQGPTGVQSGCAVTAQGTPDMTVAVAAGVARVGGRRVTVSSGNVTITAAHGTLARIDLITVDTAALKAVVTGTANSNPVTPDVPAGQVCLAEVYVPAADTAINTNQITDKRVLIDHPMFENLAWYGAIADGTGDQTTPIQNWLNACDAGAGTIGVALGGTYRHTGVVDVPVGTKVMSVGGKFANPANKTTFQYAGAAVATGAWRITEATANIFNTWFRGFQWDGGDLADYCFEIASTAGKIDTAVYFDDCAWTNPVVSSLYCNSGVTNFHFQQCRWDAFGTGYGLVLSGPAGKGTDIVSLSECTFDTQDVTAAGFIHLDVSNQTSGAIRFTLQNCRWEPNKQTAPAFTEGYIRVTQPTVDTGNKVIADIELNGVWATPPVVGFNTVPVIKIRRADGSTGNKEYMRVTAMRCEFAQRVLINDGVSDVDMGSMRPVPLWVFSAFNSSPDTGVSPVQMHSVMRMRNTVITGNPPAGFIDIYSEGEALKAKSSAGVVAGLHTQAHTVTGADHTHSGGTAGRFLRETGASAYAFEAIAFSRGGTILDPTAARFVMVWRAPFACTVTNVRGHRKGGTGATINARRNQTSDHLASDLSLTSADSWMDGGAVQNTAYAAGDDLEIEIASVAGAVTELAIQIDYTRP